MVMSLLPVSALANWDSPCLLRTNWGDVVVLDESHEGQEAGAQAAPEEEALDDQGITVTASIGTSWAMMKQWQLFTYSDKNNASATPMQQGKLQCRFH